LSANDELTVYVEADGNTKTITVTDATLNCNRIA